MINIDALYQAAENNRRSAFETAQRASQERLAGSLRQIGDTYRSSVTQAQTAARISALGQEEKLAAQGLSGGGAYAAPTTGYTETARVAADNNLRSGLHTLSAARLQQEQAARDTSSAEIASAYDSYYTGLAQLQTQTAQAKLEQYNADRSYDLSQQQLAYEKEKTAYEQSRAQEQTAYERALQRWETYGYVLPADAAILGVAAGTKTADKTYSEAKLALERWKALLP